LLVSIKICLLSAQVTLQWCRQNAFQVKNGTRTAWLEAYLIESEFTRLQHPDFLEDAITGG
jgi:hypothetical protein